MKVGTGIGCGVIVDGRVYRGAQGSAGDIGHIYVAQPDGRTVLCRCGNENCLEAIAGGGALLRDALAAGLPVTTTREVVELAAQGDGPALELVRNAGRTIGTVLAALVNFFNPHRIVMTGGVARAGAPLLAGIREAVYGRSMPLAARALEITVSDAPDLSGRVGAALMAIEGFLDEDSVHEAIGADRCDAQSSARVGSGARTGRLLAAVRSARTALSWPRCGPEADRVVAVR